MGAAFLYNLILVVENRKFLRQLYSYLETEPQYHIDIVPFSTETYDRFVEQRADIVILDMENAVPYRSILSHLKQSQWGYRVILLGDAADAALPDANVIFVEKRTLTRPRLLHTLEMSTRLELLEQGETSVILNWKGHLEFTSYPDVYYILLATYVGKDTAPLTPALIARIQTETTFIGELEIISSDARDFLCSMRKAKMRTGFEFSRLGDLLLSILGRDYVVIYSENIKWSVLEEAYADLTSLSPYSYFFRGESLAASQLHKPGAALDWQDFDEIFSDLLQRTLAGNAAEASHLLRELYLRRLKSSRSFRVRRYVRWMMALLLEVLALAAGDTPPEHMRGAASAELDYAQADTQLSAYCAAISLRALSSHTTDAAVLLFSHYRENISMESLAEQMNLNKNYLGRTFSAQLGITALKFLHRVRLYHALFLLSDGIVRVGQAARLVGYEDAGYFCKVFKKQMGFAPEDYRRKMMTSDGEGDILESIMEIQPGDAAIPGA